MPGITRSYMRNSNRKLGFGEVVVLASRQPVPKKEELNFKPAADYRYVGKLVPMVDLDAIWSQDEASLGRI